MMRQREFPDGLRLLLNRTGRPVGEIARRLGVQRGTVYKWLDGTSRPRGQVILRMKQALGWINDRGELCQLTDQELEWLLVQAGRPQIDWSAPTPGDPISVGRTLVYTYSYSRDVWPTSFRLRIMETERDLPGSRIGVSAQIPTVWHPPEVYRRFLTAESFREDVVENHVRRHQAWQETFVRRLEHSSARHIVNIDTLRSYVSLDDPWARFMRISKDTIHAEGRLVIDWLTRFRTFQVALTERILPVTYEIYGSQLLFIHFQWNLPTSGEGMNVIGMELGDPAAISPFIEQTESIWADPLTMTDKGEVTDTLGRLFDVE